MSQDSVLRNPDLDSLLEDSAPTSEQRPPPPFGEPVFDVPPQPIKDTEDTRLYQDWHDQVVKGAVNDFVILITAHSKTPVSGTGKSTLGLRIADKTDRSDSGFDADEQITFDAGELATEVLPHVERGSAVIFDEAQGSPNTSSLNSRRSMTNEAIAAVNGMLANRNRGLTVVLVGQQLRMLDINLLPLIDAWLLIVHGPEAPDGPTAVYHQFHLNDYDLSNPDPRTPAIEDLTWDALPADDPKYRTLEEKKREARETTDTTTASPEEVRRQEQVKIALRLVRPWDDDAGMNYRDAAAMTEYSKSWVGDVVRDWQKGAYRELLDKPAEEIA